MPRFPTYERSQGLSGGATASYASPGPFTAPGRALEGAGAAIADLGADIAARQQKVQDSRDDVWFSKARADTALEMQRVEQEQEQAATNGADGHVANISQNYETVRQRYLEGAPTERARIMYEEWSNSYSVTPIGKAATFQARSTLAKRDADFASTMLTHGQTVLADPSQYDAVRQRAMDDLEGAKQWMTPEQEQAARLSTEKNLQIARAQGEIQRDPASFLEDIGVTGSAEQTGQPAIDGVVDRIIGAESGGNATAKNPKSSAQGLGQFIDSTWLRVVKQYRPDVAAGKSDGQILAMKTDPSLGREMTRRYTEENAVYLTSKGHEVTAGNLYLAHFLGAGGANMTLSRDDGASLSGFLPPSVIKANPFLRGKTVGWIRNWAAEKMGGASSPPNVAGKEQYSALAFDDVIGLQQQAERAVDAQQRELTAANNAQLAEMKGAFQLGIATGDTSVTQHAILSSPLPDDDKAQLINSYNEKNKTARMAQDAAARIDSGGAFNPYDTDDRKGVGALYDSVVGDGSLFGEGNAGAVLERIYSQSGIVPKTASNQIRAGLLSDDPKVVGAAGSYASRFDGISGNLEANENGAALVEAATKYNHLTGKLGLTSEEAGQRLIDMSDPEKARQRAALLDTKPIKDTLKDVDEADIRDIWNTAGPNFLTGYEVGDNPNAAAAMVDDYRDMLSESIVDANGDVELARDLAAKRFQRIYGPSDIALSSGTIIAYPPEVAYPPGPDGTHEWVRNQAGAALLDEGIEADSVFLQPYDQTEDDFNAKRPARYQLFYERDGAIHQFNLPFYADPDMIDVTPDFSDNVSRMESNRRQETERRQIIRTGKPAQSAVEELAGVPEQVSRETSPVEKPLPEGVSESHVKNLMKERGQSRDEIIDWLSSGTVNAGGGGGF